MIDLMRLLYNNCSNLVFEINNEIFGLLFCKVVFLVDN